MRNVQRLALMLLLALTGTTASAFEIAQPAVASIQVDTTGLPSVTQAADQGNPFRGNARAAEIGRDAFNQACARCHGVDAVSKNLPGPDLTRLDKACRPIAAPDIRAMCIADNDAYFLESVRHGKVRVGVTHMPAWKDVLSTELTWAIRTFIEGRSRQQPARPAGEN